MISTCGHCQSTRFELKTQEPQGSAFKLHFIQCANCGNPIGVTDYYDQHSQIEALEEKLIKAMEAIQEGQRMILAAIQRR